MRSFLAFASVAALVAAALQVASLAEEPPKAVSPGPKPKAGPAPKSEPAEATQPKPESPEEKGARLFEEGRKALFRADYDRAIELLTAAVTADGSKTACRVNLARAFRYAEKDKEAAAQLEQVLKASPDHVEAGQLLGEIYAQQEKWDDVVRVLQPLLTYRHDYPTYHMLAEAYYHLDRHDKAREYYEEAIKLNSQSAADHYQLGNIYLAANRFAKAADAYQAALRLGMESPVLRYKLGSALFNLRNYFGRVTVRNVRSGKPGTISDGWYLIEPVPGKEDAFYGAPHGSAVFQIAKAVEDGLEDRPDIRILRASIYLNARRYRQAYQMFAALKDEVPEDERALFFYYFAEAAFGTERYDEYLKLLDKAIELKPDAYEATRVDAFLRVAEQYNQAGDLEQYIGYLAKAVEESPMTASLHLKLGNAFEDAQQHGKAIQQWNMVLDLEPDHPERTQLLNRIEKARRAPLVKEMASDTSEGEKPPPKTKPSPAAPEKPATKEKPKQPRNPPKAPAAP